MRSLSTKRYSYEKAVADVTFKLVKTSFVSVNKFDNLNN